MSVAANARTRLPEPRTEAQRRIAALIDRFDWSMPVCLLEAQVLWTKLRELEAAARQCPSKGDPIAKLLEVRLATFRKHWPHPPQTDTALSEFRTDLGGLVRHDVPHIRRLLSGLTNVRRRTTP